MHRSRFLTHCALSLVAIGAALFTGCSFPAVPGSTWLALDWVYTPEAVYFPAFPQVIYAGEYVEHEAGTYTGEYIAWDGSYWRADYWIEVDDGEDGTLFSPADDGDDYYLSLWLYSSGPALYTDDVVSRSASAGTAGGSPQAPAIEQVLRDTPALAAARQHAADHSPRVFAAIQTCGRVTVRARLERYPARGEP